MTQDFFNQQVSRLKTRFGEKAFDPESMRLLAKDLWTMSNEGLVHVVDFMISARAHTKPPLLSDFRDARIRIEKQHFNRDVNGAAQAMTRDTRTWHTGLKSFLNQNYPSAKCLMDAVNVERLKIQVKKALGQPWP